MLRRAFLAGSIGAVAASSASAAPLAGGRLAPLFSTRVTCSHLEQAERSVMRSLCDGWRAASILPPSLTRVILGVSMLLPERLMV